MNKELTVLLSAVACLSAFAKELPLAVPDSPFLRDYTSGDWIEAKPRIDADGYHIGDRMLKADPGGSIFTYTDTGRLQFSVGARVIPEHAYFAPIGWQKGSFDGKVIRRKSPCLVVRSKEDRTPIDAEYRTELEMLADGTAKMSFDAVVISNADVSCRNATWFAFNNEFIAECNLEFDADSHPNSDNWFGIRSVSFNDLTGERFFTLRFDTNTVNGINFVPTAQNPRIYFHLKNNKNFSVVFEPGKTYERAVKPFLAGGVDFETESGVRVAEYKASRNILMNPSAESGTRYWRTQIIGDIRKVVTDETAHSGKHSFKFDSSDPRFGLNVQSVGLVLKSDTDYTFSAWIKPLEGETRANFDVQPRGVHGKSSFLKNMRFNETINDGSWKRIAGTFRTITDFHECTLWLTGRGYMDDIQIEEGEKGESGEKGERGENGEKGERKAEPTEYCGNPFGLELIHDQESIDYVDSKKPINLKLRVSGPDGAKGTFQIDAKDTFDRVVMRDKFKFYLGDKGEQIFKLVSDKDLPFGSTVFTVKLDGELSYTDYLRITKIDARDGTDRLRFLQGTSGFGFSKPDRFKPDYLYSRPRDLGIGTIGYSGNQGLVYERLTKEDYDNLEKYGLKDYWGGVLWGVNWKSTLNGKPWMWEGEAVNAMTNYPPEFLKWVETECEAMAKTNSHMKFWAIDTEPSGHYVTMSKNRDFTSYAKLMLAVNRGLQKGNPGCTFLPYGMWNMVPDWGSREVADFLKICKELEPKTHFKAIEIHTYRALPEHPDVNADLENFMSQLAEVGYPDIPIKTGEGSYYYPVWRPSIGLVAWAGCGPKDAYSSFGLLGYDIGWPEKIGAALTMREEIVYLRHQDRVFSNVSWSPRTIDSTSPVAWTVAHCQLMSILGNAIFIEAIDFAKECHAYLFDDSKGNTVAFVWRGNVRYDHGLASPVEMGIAQVKGLEILDMMGNQVEGRRLKVEGFRNQDSGRQGIGASGQKSLKPLSLPLSGFPIYLRVPNARRAELAEAIRTAIVARDEALVKLLPPERAVVATYFKGFEPDWAKVPEFQEEQLVWQVAWNEDKLLFRGVTSERRLWTQGVELHFDSFANARNNFLDGEAEYDQDDFVYRLRPTEATQKDERVTDGECFRVRAPDHQLTGGAGWGLVKDVVESNVVVKVVNQPGGKTLYTAEFPLKYLMPIKLEEGRSVGLAAENHKFKTYNNRPWTYRTIQLAK